MGHLDDQTAITDWTAENAAAFDDVAPAAAAACIALWREVAEEATGLAGIQWAGPFQRHVTARGTGVPSNFLLVVTGEEAFAFKFNPRNQAHPLEVVAEQIGGKQEASWPKGSIRTGEISPGRMATGVTFEVDGGREIPCRTPRLARNPAAAAVVAALGGELPPA